MHGAVRAIVGMGKGMMMECWVPRLEVALSSTPQVPLILKISPTTRLFYQCSIILGQ